MWDRRLDFPTRTEHEWAMMTFILAACAPEDAAYRPDAPDWVDEAPVSFTFPVRERDRISDLFIMHVDHDPDDYGGEVGDIHCINFAGDVFPWCYDGHTGTDFDLIGGFDAMDAESATVIAAADGVVDSVHDGEYDRCHYDLSEQQIDCDGHPMKANMVSIAHDAGYRSLYYHLRAGSVAVEVGDEVVRGTALGLIGSSGISAAPHLHFGLVDPDDLDIDPYAGPHSGDVSFWCDQGPDRGLPGDCDVQR